MSASQVNDYGKALRAALQAEKARRGWIIGTPAPLRKHRGVQAIPCPIHDEMAECDGQKGGKPRYTCWSCVDEAARFQLEVSAKYEETHPEYRSTVAARFSRDSAPRNDGHWKRPACTARRRRHHRD